MARLVVIEGARKGAIIPLRPGGNVIGRSTGVAVCLPDVSVSRQHALVSVDPHGRATLDDAGSTNATYLNGIRVSQSLPLAHGDEIRAGNTTLLFLEEPVHAEAGIPLIDTSKISTADARFSRVPTNPAPLPAAARRPPSLATAATVVTTATAASTSETVFLPARTAARARPPYLVGESQKIKALSELVLRCAPLHTTVLIVGESGTGKELVANALHRLSPRHAEPFVVVNCANLEPALLESELFGHERGAFTGAVARRDGKLQLAGAGTILLDEVGELPPGAQAKLLRAIETRQFQRLGGLEVLSTGARFVAATHRDLAALVREGRFREDLLFRLRVVEIRVPPLRERRADVPLLVRHFLAELGERVRARARDLSVAAMECLTRYGFPGNVRELRNIVERCLIFSEGPVIDVYDLPAEVRESPEVMEATPVSHLLPPMATAAPRNGRAGGERVLSLEASEGRQVLQALVSSGWNKTQAAKVLGVHRNTLYAMMKRHGIVEPA